MTTKHSAPDRLGDVLATHYGRELEEAGRAGRLGYMARVLVQATMPHSRPKTSQFQRRNGDLVLTLSAPPDIGLPYGSVPRLAMAWLTTEAVRTGEPHLSMGQSARGFLRDLGLDWGGGATGGLSRVQAQLIRLFSTAIECHLEGGAVGAAMTIADRRELWWDPRQPDQPSLWESTVTLNRQFFEELTAAPVPIDVRTLRRLSRSPLAQDLYTWLTYRMSYLREPTLVPWAALQHQFGASYDRTRNFHAALTPALRKVLAEYPEANVQEEPRGLWLRPSPTHQRRLR